MTTDTTERGLDRLICTVLAGRPCDPAQAGNEKAGGLFEANRFSPYL